MEHLFGYLKSSRTKLTQDDREVGLYSSIPWACATIGMVWVGRHSDRTGERRWHIGLSAFIASVAFAVSGLPGLPPLVVLAVLAVAITGVMSTISCFWALTDIHPVRNRRCGRHRVDQLRRKSRGLFKPGDDCLAKDPL